jgi:C-terminal processing protease CtpA/Prc
MRESLKLTGEEQIMNLKQHAIPLLLLFASVACAPSTTTSTVAVCENYAGIGARLEGQRVVNLYRGGSAYRGGVQLGDEIVAVNSNSVVGQSDDAIARQVIGPLGTNVTIGVRREGTPEMVTFALIRECVPENF